ncbi:MAG: hypothetical protein O2958_12165 [Gemmatimonadetes bacterium]|nr:hypothetical protein [Gemmatimonadota bacterium]MDA1103017.1 hypothetical protein [Gemmatimonadota bacterium]
MIPKGGGRRLARGAGLFKLGSVVRGVVGACGCALILSPSAAWAQAPDEAWRTISTEHFRVTFPARLESLGRKAADRAEHAWTELSDFFIEPPRDVIDVVVTDHTDVSNGFAQVTPSNRITIFARPPADALSLGHMDEWMDLVITHELAHIVHLDPVRNPIGRVARGVFGRISSEWPFFPGLGTPRWIREGLATWYESRLSQAGRVRGTFNEMQLRTAVLEGRFENIGQAAGESPLWPGGNRPYAYGSLFFDFLLERHGEDRMGALVEAIAGQWIPYRLDAAGESALGVSLSSEWRAWEAQLELELTDLDARLAERGPVSEPEQLTSGARWGLHPRVSPDGRWLVYTRSDGRSDLQLHLRELGTGLVRPLGRTNGLSTFDWLPDGRLLVAQLELEDPYRTYSDLYIFDLTGGQHRLTRSARLTQPSVSPMGEHAVAVQEGDGTNSLVRVDLETGVVTVLVASDPNVHWAFPSHSPDGRWIAATRWLPDAHHDVVILDGRSGALVDQVTDDRALDMGPMWSADGRWLVWASDRSGILNILGAGVDGATGAAAAPVMLTNVRTGAAYPSVDPSGSWLYFSGYHVDGWEVERIPFEPDAGAGAVRAVARFDAALPPTVRGASTAPVEDYSPLPTLAPTYWEISSRSAVATPAISRTDEDLFLRRRELLGFALGAQTSGRDLVGRHSYSAAARVFTSGGKAEGGASYAFFGLANPILSLSVRQRYDGDGQQVQGPALDTLLTLERERGIDGAVTFSAPTWRRNVAVTVTGGLVWEHRELLGNDLMPSTLYALARPNSRLSNFSVAANYNSSRSHSFQMGTARGINAFIQGRMRTELSLPDSLNGVAGADRSVHEVIGRLRGSIPLGGGGRAAHILALQASGGVASGPGGGALHYRVGGASGSREDLTGLDLFGGDFIFFPVRGYETSSRFGRYAWSASAEYRIPLWLINRGLRAWPIHLDRAMGTLFLDAGNAWGPDVTPTGFPNTLQLALASVGAEITTEFLGLYNVEVRLRTGVAVPLVQSDGVRGYVRVGLPF